MDKETFRKETKACISALDSDYIAESDCAIAQKIIALPEFISAARVFTYVSIGREVGTKKIIEHCCKIGKPVAIPSSYENGLMSFALFNCPVETLPLGMYGIPVPPENSQTLIPQRGDIILVPALCYDEGCYRLGRGGGYYDRFLATNRAFSVGLCRDILVVKSVPQDEHDMRVDVLVTDKRIARPI